MQTTDADGLALFQDGAMTVRQAATFSGLSRRELFHLMSEGVLPWFPHGGRGTRLIPRKALVAYLAGEYAAHVREGV